MIANTKQPGYGNWVSDNRIRQTFTMFLALGLLAAALLILAPSWGCWAVALAVLFLALAAFFLVGGIYFVRAQRLFAYDGGGVQRKILEMLLSYVQWDGRGRALDIGCGSGALANMLARRFPESTVTGVDYWGGSWGYLQQQCKDNAALEGTASRTDFIQGSASNLPFADETFDLAVSNLVFHEVKDCKDKRALILEALRVVKKGGGFVFQDLFLLEPYYGKMDDLVLSLKASGIQEVRFIDSSKAAFIPSALRLPFMVGTLGTLVGIK